MALLFDCDVTARQCVLCDVLCVLSALCVPLGGSGIMRIQAMGVLFGYDGTVERLGFDWRCKRNDVGGWRCLDAAAENVEV